MDTSRPDLMTPFLRNNGDFQVMSKGEIQSTFALLIVAGSETTATSLLGTINYLASAPSVRNKLAAELDAVFASDSDIKLESLTHKPIPYLEATIKEGLRICNPVPGGLPRIVPPAGDVYAGVFLPGGVSIFYVLWRWMTLTLDVEDTHRSTPSCDQSLREVFPPSQRVRTREVAARRATSQRILKRRALR